MYDKLFNIFAFSTIAIKLKPYWAVILWRPECSEQQNSIHGKSVKKLKTEKGTYTLEFGCLSQLPKIILQDL